jgi:very-short-patch-repair endonuclease
MALCECGKCGREAKPGNRFIKGHNNHGPISEAHKESLRKYRAEHPLTEAQKKQIGETLRRKYAEDVAYREQKQEMYKRPERSEKLRISTTKSWETREHKPTSAYQKQQASKANKDKVVSAETRALQSKMQSNRSPEHIEKIRQNAIKQWATPAGYEKKMEELFSPAVRVKRVSSIKKATNTPEHKAIRKLVDAQPSTIQKRRINAANTQMKLAEKGYKSGLEEKAAKLLSEMYIAYKRQYFVNQIEHVYAADFYLPEYHVILETDGDFWHGPSKPEQQELDKIRTKEMKDAGYNVFRIWEHDINKFKELLTAYLGTDLVLINKAVVNV